MKRHSVAGFMIVTAVLVSAVPARAQEKLVIFRCDAVKKGLPAYVITKAGGNYFFAGEPADGVGAKWEMQMPSPVLGGEGKVFLATAKFGDAGYFVVYSRTYEGNAVTLVDVNFTREDLKSRSTPGPMTEAEYRCE